MIFHARQTNKEAFFPILYSYIRVQCTIPLHSILHNTSILVQEAFLSFFSIARLSINIPYPQDVARYTNTYEYAVKSAPYPAKYRINRLLYYYSTSGLPCILPDILKLCRTCETIVMLVTRAVILGWCRLSEREEKAILTNDRKSIPSGIGYSETFLTALNTKNVKCIVTM